MVPKFLIDRDGDAANNGTGFGKPAKDLSINYVPVPYPDYPPADDRDEARRTATVARVECLGHHLPQSRGAFNRVPQPLGLVAMDGVPMNQNDPQGESVDPQTHIGLPPGARVEFIVKGPPAG